MFTKDIDKDGRIAESDDLAGDILSTEIAILNYDEDTGALATGTFVLTNNYDVIPPFDNHIFDHIDAVPVWSPNGNQVLFASGKEAQSVGDLDLFILDADRKEDEPDSITLEPNNRVKLTNLIDQYVNPEEGEPPCPDSGWILDSETPMPESDPHWSDAPDTGQYMSTIVFTRSASIDGGGCWDDEFPPNPIDCPVQEIWMIKYDYDVGEVMSCPVKITDTSQYEEKTCKEGGGGAGYPPPCPLGDTDPKISPPIPIGGPGEYEYKFATAYAVDSAWYNM